MEITVAEFRKWEPGSYRLIDIRGDQDVAYGMVPGAIHMPAEGLLEAVRENPEFAGQKLVVYCTRGRFSVDAAAELKEAHWGVYHALVDHDLAAGMEAMIQHFAILEAHIKRL